MLEVGQDISELVPNCIESQQNCDLLLHELIKAVSNSTVVWILSAKDKERY
jgi:hypothetical protein